MAQEQMNLEEPIAKARVIANRDYVVVVIEINGKRIPVFPDPPKQQQQGYSPSIIPELNRGD